LKFSKLSIISMLICAIFIVSGCNSKPASAPKPEPEAPEKVARKILEYQSYQQWQQLYKYIHPDTQKLMTEQEFIQMQESNMPSFEIVEIKDAILLDSWTDRKGNGKTYRDVAELPFTLNENIMGQQQAYKASMHLVKDSEGLWKYFSDIPSKK